MSFTLDYFKSRKQNIQSKLSQLQFILQELDLDQEYKQIVFLKDQLNIEQFQIIVVGEFSRGKSMFINALIGDKILPSSSVPTTTILNKINYSEKPYIQLYYKDQTKQEINRSEFNKLVAPMKPIEGDSESENEFNDNIRILERIAYAEIGQPLSFCGEGITIIDSPGLNEDLEREQITSAMIPFSDAAIVIFSATQITSESEISMLRDRIIKSDLQKIFLVINFKDDLQSEVDERRVIDQAYQKVGAYLPNRKIYLVSAKKALKSKRLMNGDPSVSANDDDWTLERAGFVEFESELANFLQFEQGNVKLKKPLVKAKKIILSTINNYLQIEKNALKHSQFQLKEKVEAFQEELNTFKQTGKEALKILKGEISKEEVFLQEWYSNELAEISTIGMKTLSSNIHNSELDSLPQLVEHTIAPLERDLSEAKSTEFKNALQKAFDKASKKLNQDWDLLDHQFKQMFNSSGMENSLNTSLIVESDNTKSEDIIMFEDIFNDLISSFRSSTTNFGKFVSGLGLGVAVAAFSIVEAGKSIFSWFNGQDKVSELKSKIYRDLQKRNQNKPAIFKMEFNRIANVFNHQFENMINSQIINREKQLDVLLANTLLEENEIAEKKHWIENIEKQLLILNSEISQIEKEINQKHEIEVNT